MKSIPSLLRQAEHQALSTITLTGSVLDLGGEKGSEYLSHIQGSFTTTAVNLDSAAKPDIMHDLEEKLSLADASYDHVLLINVMEHVFNYRQLLSEAVRTVRPGGKIVVIVPFLFPVHPSPRDYWRFTDEALRKELETLGTSDIKVMALGSGVFAARALFLDRLLPYPLRFISYYIGRHFVALADAVFLWCARMLGKKYSPHDYALGYLATATR